MQKAISITVLVLMTACMCSCKKHLNAVDYLVYITDKHNGFKKVTQIDGWEFAIQYRPYDYIILTENKGNKGGYDVQKRRAELAGTAWFSLSLKRTDNSTSPMRYGVASMEEYNARLNYYLNEAGRDYKLIYGKDTLYPISYLFENNYNLTPQETMLIGFQLPPGEDHPVKDMNLSFIDHVFKTGIVKAAYTKETLLKTPDLIY